MSILGAHYRKQRLPKRTGSCCPYERCVPGSRDDTLHYRCYSSTFLPVNTMFNAIQLLDSSARKHPERRMRWLNSTQHSKRHWPSSTSKQGGWSVELHLAGSQPQCIAEDPLQPQRIYCGTFDQGLWFSNDAGSIWKHVDEGIPHKQVTSVAVSQVEHITASSVVYVGTEPSSIFRSEDGGSTWLDLASLRQLPSAPTWSFPPRPSTHHVRWITPDPLVAGRVFAAIEAGALIRSHDGG